MFTLTLSCFRLIVVISSFVYIFNKDPPISEFSLFSINCRIKWVTRHYMWQRVMDTWR